MNSRAPKRSSSQKWYAALTKEEISLLRSLKTPQKIQDFLSSIPMNHEPEGDTCLSPRRVLREHRAHCIEGAMLAAVALRLQGFPPLILDLTASDDDFDHVVAIFRKGGCFGAISKTNHAVLRYREPIYRTVRELAMSYFHEYFLDDGRKTLRSYSLPCDLSRFDRKGWITDEEDVWYIPESLVHIRHIPLLQRSQIHRLRPAEAIERKAGTIIEWPVPAEKARL